MPADTLPRQHVPVLLCADDYGISEGVSRGILELARAERLSAFSAMVTLPRWPRDAAAVGAVRPRLSIGLHLNLTLGAPLGPMPRLAPAGRLPGVGDVIKTALAGGIDAGEIEAETRRQIEAFRDATGALPDHIDGHQHVHALRGVRDGVLAAIASCYRAGPPPLVRDPADTLTRIAGRGLERTKALAVAALAVGFGTAAEASGCAVNAGFSGFSAFDRRRAYAEELALAFRSPGPRHMIMCHPGYPDAELAALDPVQERRDDERRALLADDTLPARLLHPVRDADGRIDWSDWGGRGAAR